MVLDVLELWEFSVFLYRVSTTGVQRSPGCLKPSFMSSRFVAFYWVSRAEASSADTKRWYAYSVEHTNRAGQSPVRVPPIEVPERRRG